MDMFEVRWQLGKLRAWLKRAKLRWVKAWILGDLAVVNRAKKLLTVFPSETNVDMRLSGTRIRACTFGEARWVTVYRLNGRRKLAEIHYHYYGGQTIVWPPLLNFFS